MVFLRLAAEARDEVAGEGGPGYRVADVPHQLQVCLPRVSAPHALQHRAAPRLRGHVQLRAHIGPFQHHVQELVREVLGVRGREADAHLGVDLRDPVEELREADGAVPPGLIHRAEAGGVHSKGIFHLCGPPSRGAPPRHRRCCRPLASAAREVRKGVNVLPEEGDLLHPLLREHAHLVQHGGRGPGPLPPPRERHDAEGAHVVAAPHDAHKGRGRPLGPHWSDVRVRLLRAQLHVHGVRALGPAPHGRDEARQVTV
mmetsp:Transcript_6403/g.21999  ORF Transcript_6403/g.21999 Transcript_6403/m.21999 type:complete len:257 (-) Transcript_6403:719-1489(-)